MNRILHSLLPVALIATLSAILYAPLLFGGKVLYWGVYLLQFYPWRQLAVEQIRAGHWPLWNPYLGAGTPLAANLQTAAFYPPNVLFLLIPVEQAFGWEQALHVALAGLFACYLGRTLRLRRFSALVTGLTYGLGGYMIARWVFPTMINAAAWLPLMLALAERLLGREPEQGIRYAAGYASLLALVVALQLLAGHAQTSFYSLLILSAFTLVRAIQRVRHSADEHDSAAHGLLFPVSQTLRLMLPIALAGLWALALAAIQLLPTAEFVTHSQRASTLEDMTFAYELSFWPWRLITLVAPDFFGNPARGGYWGYGTYWEEAAYVGILPLILALLAGVSWWRSRRKEVASNLALVPFLILLGLVSLLLALGRHTPLYPLVFRYVPGFGLFQAPARLIIGYALAVPLLAGIGADRLMLTPRLRTWLRLAAVAGLGAALAGAAARLALPDVQPSFGLSALRLGLILAVSAGLLSLYGRRLRGLRWQALATALIAADLVAFGWALAPGTDPAVYHGPVDTAGYLHEQPAGRLLVMPAYSERVYDEYVSLESFGSSDPAYLQSLRESLHANMSTVHHLPAVGNYDPLTVGLFHDLCSLLEAGTSATAGPKDGLALLDLFAARYVLGTESLNLPILYNGGPLILENHGALPEAFVVHRARVLEDPMTRLITLRDPEFNSSAEVLLSTWPAQATMPSTGQPRPELAVSILRDGPNLVIIGADLAEAGYLVLVDIFYPGWQATVNGEAAEILPANHAFRAVALDGGQHTVVFEYNPLSFRLGAWISLGSVLLLAATLAHSALYDKIWKK